MKCKLAQEGKLAPEVMKRKLAPEVMKCKLAPEGKLALEVMKRKLAPDRSEVQACTGSKRSSRLHHRRSSRLDLANL